MQLETMEPNPVWDPTAHRETVDTLSELTDATYKIWGGDWCGDCRSKLPDFAAALDAAGVPPSHIEHYPVDQDKRGDGVEEYGIEFIPTVVVERDGEELARFVEDEGMSIPVYLASELEESAASA
ncbi:MAG: thioredoxin family protein [Halorhabdus sp.]